MIILPVDDQERWPDGACEHSLGGARDEICRHRALYIVNGVTLCKRHAQSYVFEIMLQRQQSNEGR